jgi:glycosyltransferase involved in cell wall biosynthesis
MNSIKDQTYHNLEIIIVDNDSIDDTLNIARKFTPLVFSYNPERSSQINYGVKKSSGKYIYRVDSDFVLEPNVIKEAVTLAESNNFAAVLIHNTSDSTVSYWARVRKFERDMYESENLNVAVRFIRKDIFLSLGGFDPELIYGEDYDLHNRIIQNYEIGKVNAKEMHLGEYKTLLEIARKNYYYGRSANKFLRKNKGRGMKQVNPFRKAYFRNFKKFGRNPVLASGFVVYQIVRYGAGGLGLFATLISNLSSQDKKEK